jgi:SAM-dependent methyltransferase
MAWYYAVAERDHELQNPTSRDKIRELGERLRLGPDTEVLDVGCGKAGPAILLARWFGCRITGIERAPEFAAVARDRVAAAGLSELVEIVEQDASETELRPETFDAALCLGASFVWSTLPRTLEALMPCVRPSGHVVVGEPYWRRWPLPAGAADEGFVTFAETVARFERTGLVLDTVIASSEDDWDRYESLHWRALEEWLDANPDHPDAPEIRSTHERNRAEYVSWQRELLGWAIFAARKPSVR